jgi:hypothetical protein
MVIATEDNQPCPMIAKWLVGIPLWQDDRQAVICNGSMCLLEAAGFVPPLCLPVSRVPKVLRSCHHRWSKQRNEHCETD